MKRKRGGQVRHGMCNHPIYLVWKGMKTRCLNKNSKSYHHYGGRGITVCDRWLRFENFYEDIKDKYQEGLELDRIDNDGNYTPENIRLSSRSENMSNTRVNVSFHGETASEASKRLVGRKGLVDTRIRDYGWSIEKAFTTPVNIRTTEFMKNISRKGVLARLAKARNK